MDNYYEQRPKKSPVFTYVTLVLISAILSSALSLALASKIFPALTQQQPVTQTGSALPSAASGAVATSTQQLTANSASSPFQAVNIAKTVGPAIVGIANFQAGGPFGGSNMQEVGSGSGIIIDAKNGYIVTNNHVIAGADKIVVSLADGRNITAKLVGADSRTDLAVVQIKGTSGLVAAPIGDSNALQVGDPVIAIGNPGGEEFARSVTEGVVSALNRVLQLTGESSFNLIQTDAAINPGNSGGALVNWQGQVVGINSAKNQQPGFEGMGFAIPITDAMPVIDELMQTGHASHAGMFVSIDGTYDGQYAQAQNMPAGALVASVQSNGPAAKAGMQQGDIITSVNGKPIANFYDLSHELFKYKAGDTIKVGVYRNGKQLTLQVTLAELPPTNS